MIKLFLVFNRYIFVGNLLFPYCLKFSLHYTDEKTQLEILFTRSLIDLRETNKQTQNKKCSDTNIINFIFLFYYWTGQYYAVKAVVKEMTDLTIFINEINILRELVSFIDFLSFNRLR